MSSSELLATVPASCLTVGQTVNVSVGGSNSLQFVIGGSGSGGSITLTTVSPTIITAGTATTLYVYGANFTTNSIVHFNNSVLSTTYLSSGELLATILGSSVVAGSLPVFVTDPSTGTSGTLYVTVSAASVTLTSLSQTSAAAGGPSFTLILYGSGFSAGNLLNFGSLCTVGTTFVSSAQLTATIPGSCLTTAQTVNVSVSFSNSLTFTITGTGSGITLSSVSPNSLAAGSTTTLYLYGTNFSPNSIVHLNNTAVNTTYLSSTLLYGAIPGSLLTPGSMPVYVADPSSGTSGALYVTVTSSSPTGIITASSLSPGTLTAGTATTLYVYGTNFTTNSVIRFNNNAFAPTFVNSTQLYAMIPGSLVTAGILPVYVSDSSTGMSGTLYATVTGLSLAAITPNSVPAGSGALTVTLFGQGFTSGASLAFGSSCTVGTTFVSSSQLTAIIPASCVTTAQNINVSVSGSNAVLFSIGLSINCSPSTGPATVGVSYSQTCSVSGGVSPYTWTVSGLPAGLAQNGTIGPTVAIAGTPTVSQSYAYTVQVTDSSGTQLSGSLIISGTIGSGGTSITSLSPSTIAAGSGATTLSVFGNGLSPSSIIYFNGIALATTYVSSIQLSALIPAALLTASETASITVNNAGVSSNALTLVIGSGGGGPLSVTCSPGVGPQTYLTAFFTACTATGGTQPYSWPTPAGLPSDLTLSASTGSSVAISGTPNTSLPYNFTVKVTDSSSPVQSVSLQLAGQVNATSGTGGIALTSLSPTSVPLNSATISLTVNGSGFTSNSAVFLDGFTLVTTYLSGNQLMATVPSGLLTYARASLITVITPGVGTSNGLSFIVGTGVTTTISISCYPGVGPSTPNTSFASDCVVNGGTGPFFWTVSAGTLPPGLKFTPDGVSLSISGYTTLNGPYSYTIQVQDSSSPANIGTAVFAGMTEVGNGGCISVTSVSPSILTAETATTLYVYGTGFTPNSSVYFNGSAVSTAYLSPSELDAPIPAYLVTAGRLSVVVLDPTTGTSATLYVTVTAPGLTLNSISPASIPAGSSAFTLTVFGSGFLSGALLNFGAVCTLNTIFVSSSQVTATVPAVCVTAGQTLNVSVGGSNALPFVITPAASGPITLSSVSPSTLTGGVAATLYLYGVNFTQNSVIHFNNYVVPTTYMNSGELSGSIPGPYITSGSMPVYVTDPSLGTSSTLYVTSAGSAPNISGQVTVSGVGLSGVTILVNGSQTTSTDTDVSGNYSIALDPYGTYTVAPARAGYSFSAPITFSNLVSSQTANFSGIAAAGLEFYPVTPCRVADTRTGAGFTGAFGPPSMSPGTRTFPIPSSSCGIPTTAAAYSLNFTVVPQGPLGVLTIWPAGQTMPNVSTLNSYSGNVVANAAIVPAGTNSAISVYVNNTTDLLFDINGYFAPPLASGLQFYPVTPCRIADTRTGAGFTGAFGPPSMAAATQRSFPIPSSNCGIPATAAAYSLNFTVVPPGPLGYLTTWPTGKAMPNASTLNSYTGAVVANAAIVPAGTNSAISLYVNNATDVLFDINGYFAPPAAGGLQFYPVTPCRIADTRTGAGFPGPFGPPSMVALVGRSFPIPSSICELPASAGAYSFNFTVVPPAPLGFLTTWPTGNSMPNVSTLNSYNGSVVANAAIVPAGTGGAVSVYVNNATDVLFDVNGYFSQ